MTPALEYQVNPLVLLVRLPPGHLTLVMSIREGTAAQRDDPARYGAADSLSS